MSRLLAIAILLPLVLLTASQAGAISRYSAMQIECGEINAIIKREGAAIFRYPSPRKFGLTLYDRYVRDSSFCSSHQSLERVLIPSLGGEQCAVRHCTSRPDRRCVAARCD